MPLMLANVTVVRLLVIMPRITAIMIVIVMPIIISRVVVSSILAVQ